MQFSVWHRSKCTIFSLDLLKTYAIFLHWERQLSRQFYVYEWDMQFSCSHNGQLSWQFYVFEQVTSFLHRERLVSRWFYVLNKTCNFYEVDILHFPGTLWKTRRYQLTQHAFLGQKQQKCKNCQKMTHTKSAILFVSLCFEPSQPQRITSGLNCAIMIIVTLIWCYTPINISQHCTIWKVLRNKMYTSTGKLFL